VSLARRWRAPSLPRDGPPNAAVIDRTSAVPLAARDLTLHQFPMRLEEAAMTGCGPRPTPRGLRAASPLTEVHRPRGRQAVDVVGAPAYDPFRTNVAWKANFYILHLSRATRHSDQFQWVGNSPKPIRSRGVQQLWTSILQHAWFLSPLRCRLP
jgi:hypothetical protein